MTEREREGIVHATTYLCEVENGNNLRNVIRFSHVSPARSQSFHSLGMLGVYNQSQASLIFSAEVSDVLVEGLC